MAALASITRGRSRELGSNGTAVNPCGPGQPVRMQTGRTAELSMIGDA